VAEDARGAFGQGVRVVDLSPLRDPALVLPAIARAAGVREAGGRLLESVQRAL
jgi:hypothetical protein